MNACSPFATGTRKHLHEAVKVPTLRHLQQVDVVAIKALEVERLLTVHAQNPRIGAAKVEPEEPARPDEFQGEELLRHVRQQAQRRGILKDCFEDHVDAEESKQVAYELPGMAEREPAQTHDTVVESSQ